MVSNPILIYFSNDNKSLHYYKWQLKEDDMFVSENNNRNAIVLAKVIMNEKSISAFKWENYDSNVISFNLKETKIAKDDKDNKCFVLSNNFKKFIFCAFITANNKVDERVYDINLFKINALIRWKLRRISN